MANIDINIIIKKLSESKYEIKEENGLFTVVQDVKWNFDKRANKGKGQEYFVIRKNPNMGDIEWSFISEPVRKLNIGDTYAYNLKRTEKVASEKSVTTTNKTDRIEKTYNTDTYNTDCLSQKDKEDLERIMGLMKNNAIKTQREQMFTTKITSIFNQMLNTIETIEDKEFKAKEIQRVKDLVKNIK